MGTHLKPTSEALLISTNNIWFYAEVRKYYVGAPWCYKEYGSEWNFLLWSRAQVPDNVREKSSSIVPQGPVVIVSS